MDIRITETGETRNLKMIDAATGIDCTADFLTLHDAAGTWNGNDELVMSAYQFGWWKEVLQGLQYAEAVLIEAKKNAPDYWQAQDIADEIIDRTDVEMEASSIMEAVDAIEALSN